MARQADWLPEEELRLLTEAPLPSVAKVQDKAIIAQAIFKDHVDLAAQTICDMAVGSESEKMRFAASKFVVERVMGRSPEANQSEQASPWEQLLGSVAREPSYEERQQGVKVSRLS